MSNWMIAGITLACLYVIIALVVLGVFYYAESRQVGIRKLHFEDHVKMVFVAVGWFPALAWVGIDYWREKRKRKKLRAAKVKEKRHG